MNLATSLGDYIRTRRLAAGLSLREAARRVDLSYTAISMIEKDTIPLGPHMANLAKAIPGIRARDIDDPHGAILASLQQAAAEVAKQPAEHKGLALLFLDRLSRNVIPVSSFRSLFARIRAFGEKRRKPKAGPRMGSPQVFRGRAADVPPAAAA